MQNYYSGNGINRDILATPNQILENRGYNVKLVNARHIKNVPGRKTDVKDSDVAILSRTVYMK